MSALSLRDECKKYVLNTGMMNDRAVEQFKVWPTQADREQFAVVITSGSWAAIESQYPLTKRKYARTSDPRPRMVEAYLYFYQQLREFFIGTANEPPIGGDRPIAERLESYVVRRSVCGLTPKNYNRIFLNIIKRCGAMGQHPKASLDTFSA